jgi:hypothetical protein
MMRERALRRQCRQLLTELDIRPQLDVGELCLRLGQRRGKPIRLLAHAIPPEGPFGAWIASTTADYIIYQSETSKAHQNHIILHEIGHMVANHNSTPSDEDLTENLYPGIPLDPVSGTLLRTCYDTQQEREAETVATIILEWASVLDRLLQPASTDIAVHRMELALGDRLGWL